MLPKSTSVQRPLNRQHTIPATTKETVPTMKISTAYSVLICVLLMCSGLHATAARHVPASSQRRLAQAGQLGYVPQGCQGIQFAVTGYHGYTWEATPMVYGTVIISNPNNFAIPLDQVVVQVANDVTVAPIFANATCLGTTVPAPTDFASAGRLTCTYQIDLPNNGIAAGPTHWPSVMATATIDMSNAKCSSAVTQIDTSFWARLAQGLISTFDPSSAGTGTPQGLTATAGSSNGGRRLSQAGAAQVQTGQLGYVPNGCQGMSVITNDARYELQGPVVSGTVVLTNPDTFDIPIASVNVTLINNRGLPPLFTTATCPGAVVPSNPHPYTLGEMVCTFTYVLPNNGPLGTVPSPIWTNVMATATIAMSDAECSSPVAVVPPPQPVVYGH